MSLRRPSSLRCQWHCAALREPLPLPFFGDVPRRAPPATFSVSWALPAARNVRKQQQHPHKNLHQHFTYGFCCLKRVVGERAWRRPTALLRFFRQNQRLAMAKTFQLSLFAHARARFDRHLLCDRIGARQHVVLDQVGELDFCRLVRAFHVVHKLPHVVGVAAHRFPRVRLAATLAVHVEPLFEDARGRCSIWSVKIEILRKR